MLFNLKIHLISGSVKSSYLPDNDFSKLQNWEGLLFQHYQIDIEANGEDILQILANELENRFENLLSPTLYLLGYLHQMSSLL